jgi:hypothetical protein
MMVSNHGEETPLQEAEERERFEQSLRPHPDAAYNLARWLTRDDHDMGTLRSRLARTLGHAILVFDQKLHVDKHAKTPYAQSLCG